MTKSQINKLGTKLREASTPDDDALAQLQALRRRYDAPLAKAQLLVEQAIGIKTTSRLKTVNTIIEKLRRDKTRLAEMQDIAGLRIVEEMGLSEQDRLTTHISELFPSARVVDRRRTPSYGYRAVHVVASVDNVSVEIQVRTRMQDLWAQAMEKFSDERGRGIRYGQIPAEHAAEVEKLLEIGSAMGSVEEMQQELREMEEQLPKARQASINQDKLRLQRFRIAQQRDKLNKLSTRMRGILSTVLGGKE